MSIARLVSVIVPAYNEPDLAAWLDGLRSVLAPFDAEILVVDDSEPPLAPIDGVRVMRGCRRGKGAAVRDGILAARGEVIAFIDADASEDMVARIPAFIRAVDEGSDVVIAERAAWHGPDLVRKLLALSFCFVQRVFIFHSLRFRDTQCGLKAFRAEPARRLANAQSIFGGLFDVEYLYVATLDGLRIAQVPVPTPPELRPSHFNFLRFLASGPSDLVRMKWNGVRGRYAK